MNERDRRHRHILKEIARRAMRERGFEPDFPPDVIEELDRMKGPAAPDDGSARDMRSLPWCSIDNEDSRDLDQLNVAREAPGGGAVIFIAVADVDALVSKNTAIDRRARQNTVSVYTAAEIFPMLPERLSTDLTSLNLEEDRLAVVIEMTLSEAGALVSSDVYRAVVRNRAKLDYRSVASWLEGETPVPAGISAVECLDENLRLQCSAAQKMKTLRHSGGALDFRTIETKPVFDGEYLKDLEAAEGNLAREIIEEFMIAANGVSARYVESRNLPSIRRVVRTPKRWDRIVELAEEHGASLPPDPDPRALERFLESAEARDPEGFPDLSLSVVKLIGSGEYAVEFPGREAPGHFGLAVKDYAHSTAPNRRYPDLVTQRLLKAAVAGKPSAYGDKELEEIAAHCTRAEDAAKKVERQVTKSAAAILLGSRIGQRFDAVVTGASPKGTWVRIFHPPVEGRLEAGYEGMDVGRRLRVELTSTDVERGFIDFKRV